MLIRIQCKYFTLLTVNKKVPWKEITRRYCQIRVSLLRIRTQVGKSNTDPCRSGSRSKTLVQSKGSFSNFIKLTPGVPTVTSRLSTVPQGLGSRTVEKLGNLKKLKALLNCQPCQNENRNLESATKRV